MEDDKTKVIKVSVADKLSLSEETIATSKGPSGEGIRRVDSEGHSTAKDQRDKQVQQSISGPTIRNEEGTRKTCEILVSKLNQDGGDWYGLRSPTEDDSVDGRAYSRGERKKLLEIQVTKADQQIWRKLAKTPSGVNMSGDIDSACAVLLDAVHKKKNVDGRANLVLALEAVHYPLPKAVADRFREITLDKARAIGFKAIWLVGPTESHTYQLD